MLKKIKENLIQICIFIILILSFTIELPYYIDKTGGIIDLNSRINYKDKKDYNGSINMAYVSEIKATPFNMFIAKINDKWDINPKDKITNNENTKYLNKMSLNEAINNAILVAFKKADKKITKTNSKIYVTYIYDEAKTNLEIEDQIISINNQKISSKQDINEIISNTSGNVNIEVLNNGKKYIRTADIIELENKKIIGILIGEDYNLKMSPKIDVNFKENEYGPSGGLMMSLAIYSQITDIDIIRGRKIAGTGTIDENGLVGEIDGVKYKLAGAVKNKMNIFIVPLGDNYKTALLEKEKNNYDIEIVGVSNFDEALEYLKR